jgi:murein DD-endopeptidase MepM/ murein hydrolase activator NlpD
MDLRIHYPFKPYQITQYWGVLNPAYANKFNNPAFKRHNGIDARVGAYVWAMKDGKLQKVISTEYPVYCPVEGFRVTEVEYYPEGGGHQIGLVSKQKVQVGDKLCYASILLCHAKKILVKVGDEPAVGELLMIADNTGFSTGMHTHMGLYRLNNDLQKLDINEATGSYDPALFFTGMFAEEQSTMATRITSGMRYWRYLAGLS